MGWTAGVQFPAGEIMFFFSSSPLLPDSLGGPPSLLSTGYQGFYNRHNVAGA